MIDMKTINNYKNNLEEIRASFELELSNYSGYEFSKITGISEGMISRHKRGERHISFKRMIDSLDKIYKKK